jgi:hypothetical protein
LTIDIIGVNFVFYLLIEDADMEDYGFEYSDDEPEEQDVDIENQYYNSKGYLSIFSLNFSIFPWYSALIL